MTVTPRERSRPRWWRVWLLPFATRAVLGIALATEILVWWRALGGRRVVRQASRDVSRGTATATCHPIVEPQRIQGVDTSSAARLPVYWGDRRVARTNAAVLIGPRPPDTVLEAAERWVRAESLVRASLGSHAGILGSAPFSRAADSPQRPTSLAALLVRPGCSVIYVGRLKSGVDTVTLASVVAALDSAPSDSQVTAIRLRPGTATPDALRGQLWLGPGPVIVPLE